jgi:hypothetical protein
VLHAPVDVVLGEVLASGIETALAISFSKIYDIG